MKGTDEEPQIEEERKRIHLLMRNQKPVQNKEKEKREQMLMEEEEDLIDGEEDIPDPYGGYRAALDSDEEDCGRDAAIEAAMKQFLTEQDRGEKQRNSRHTRNTRRESTESADRPDIERGASSRRERADSFHSKHKVLPDIGGHSGSRSARDTLRRNSFEKKGVKGRNVTPGPAPRQGRKIGDSPPNGGSRDVIPGVTARKPWETGPSSHMQTRNTTPGRDRASSFTSRNMRGMAGKVPDSPRMASSTMHTTVWCSEDSPASSPGVAVPMVTGDGNESSPGMVPSPPSDAIPGRRRGKVSIGRKSFMASTGAAGGTGGGAPSPRYGGRRRGGIQ